jgi:hypothetical protein
MLIFYLVVSCCAVIFCALGIVITIRDGEWGLASFALLLGAISSILLFAVIDTIRRDNTQTIEYYFPADHYTFEQIITETNETKYVGADTLVVVKRDTTYKLVGQDPIIGGSKHLKREYPDTSN